MSINKKLESVSDYPYICGKLEIKPNATQLSGIQGKIVSTGYFFDKPCPLVFPGF
jgi:hypothetical protein